MKPTSSPTQPTCIWQSSVAIAWVGAGLGKHAEVVGTPGVEHGLKLLYIAYFPCGLGITLAKYSALCFYSRIFDTNRKFRIAVWIGHGLNTASLIYAILTFIFECTPISFAWDKTMMPPGHCLDFYSWYLASAITAALSICTYRSCRCRCYGACTHQSPGSFSSPVLLPRDTCELGMPPRL